MLMSWAVVAGLSMCLLWFFLSSDFQQHQQLLLRYNQLTADYEEALALLAKADVNNEILRNADLNVRQTLSLQQSQLEQQARQLEFYQLLMEGGQSKQGLALNSYRLWPIDQEQGVFGFQFVFVQYAKKHYLLRAALNIDIVGEDSQAPSQVKSFPLAALAYQTDQSDVKKTTGLEKLRFKYFQKVEGLLTLPKGFKPSEIQLRAKNHKKRVKVWQQTVPWLLED